MDRTLKMGTPFRMDPLRLALAEGNPPQWASGWGEDRYGLFVAFTLEEVTQRLRWIPPGRFMMGSPKDEAERYSDEGPQHEVRFAQGFWLFDTACTQALWQAVMGNNPSHFQSTDRPPQPCQSTDLPVEQVNWEDVQTFLARLNAHIPGLGLTLPSEAQWEYACRAGTTTPFSFGANITPEQVNYDGNVPYAHGPKGEDRQKTVPVASLPPNPWGLFEMHGNLLEWCADDWHDAYQDAPTDGRAWIDVESTSLSGVERVVRGGSWLSYARSVRAACRLAYQPDVRYRYLGFRCSRVHS